MRYANVTSTLALVVALGGTGAYAANTIGSSDIRNGGVRNADLARNAVTSGKVRNGTLRARDFKRGELPAGLPGPPGARGPQGPKGDPGAIELPAVAPPGSTQRGSFAFSGYYLPPGTVPEANNTGPADGQISFPVPLAAPPRVQVIRRTHEGTEGAATAQCPGSVLDPQAAPGWLCVYESRISNNNGLETFSTFDGQPGEGAPTRFGVGLNIDDAFGPDSVHRTSKGTWAVTAP